VTTRAVTLAALMAALGRPSWWLLALAGFLVRGGLVLFALAIVSLPSPLIVSNAVAPILVPVALGRVDAGTIALLGLGVTTLAAWLVGAGGLAAATEIVLIKEARDAMADEGLSVRTVEPSRRWLIGRVATAHLLAHVPTAVALGLGSVRIAGVAYVELTSPFEVTTPLVLRVIAGAAVPIAVILVVWLFGETLGGLAARRIVLDGASLVDGLRRAVGDIIRRLPGTLLSAFATTLIMAIDIAAMLAAVAFVWTQVADRLLDPTLSDWSTTTIALLTFAGTWIGALALTGLIGAWRSAAMTFEVERAAIDAMPRASVPPDPPGTIGASASRRPGDWSAGQGGGSL
jgi:hypothetical protein